MRPGRVYYSIATAVAARQEAARQEAARQVAVRLGRRGWGRREGGAGLTQGWSGAGARVEWG